MNENQVAVNQVSSDESSRSPSSPTRWILTGGAGFLGTNFLMSSHPEDGEIVVLDRRQSPWLLSRPWIRFVEQDVREVDAFRKELIPGSVVIHMASVSYPGKAEQMIESDIQDNVIGTIRFANACADQGVRSFLFMSSGGAIYGDQPMTEIPETANPQPLSAYGAMKLTIEHYLRITHHLRGLNVAMLRVGNPFGPWHPGMGQGAVNVFMKQVLHGELIEVWGDGEQIRDYIPVQDVAEAIRVIGMRFVSGCDAFNIGTGTGRSLNDILQSIEEVTGKTARVQRFPARGVDVAKNILDCTKMKARFNWESTAPFSQAIHETWEWAKASGL